MKKLTVVTTVIEVGAGVALMCCPSATVALLLGSPLDTPAAGVTLGRVTLHKYTIMEHLGLKTSAPAGAICPRAWNVEKAQLVFARTLLVLTVSTVSRNAYK